jgi:hypothetical protein
MTPEFRLRTRTLVAGYVLAFLLLAVSLRQPWPAFTLVQKVTRLGAGAFRYFIVHHDTPSVKLQVDVQPHEVALRGSGFRNGGVGIVVHAHTLITETPCPLHTPHVHPARADEELVVAFEARRHGEPSSVAVSIGNGNQHHYATPEPLERAWHEYRVRMHGMGPGGASFPEVTFPYLMLRFHPNTEANVSLRGLRVLRVPRAAVAAQPSSERP